MGSPGDSGVPVDRACSRLVESSPFRMPAVVGELHPRLPDYPVSTYVGRPRFTNINPDTGSRAPDLQQLCVYNPKQPLKDDRRWYMFFI